MVEVNPKPVVTDPFDDLSKRPKQSIIANAFVIERRQHKHASTSGGYGMTREFDRLGERAHPGPRHHPMRRQTTLDKSIEHVHFLGTRHGIRLGVRSKNG